MVKTKNKTLVENLCIVPNCFEVAQIGIFATWFCIHHTEVKEAAYAEARELGLTNYYDVMTLRDKRLNEKTKHKK